MAYDFTKETRLLRAAVEASMAAAIADPGLEHFADSEPYTKHAEAVEKADAAWEEYDRLIWITYYAE